MFFTSRVISSEFAAGGHFDVRWHSADHHVLGDAVDLADHEAGLACASK
jgi:hypothetical protein